ncbi:MAG: UTP--glucose-1-phosphate uridylyltransferase, partial [Alphaproteobacteria bacterium]|nr:UTP--glucose-1-phosphate uridylyltransferase [Alphaproteobacteria bacterium]
MSRKIRKVVFPVGGFGTRFLPATKSMPKEMLPVVDKPLIHYAFDEAREAGIEQFIFITGRNKTIIDNHFDHSYELQSHLSKSNK